jgi:hypothetical protein
MVTWLGILVSNAAAADSGSATAPRKPSAEDGKKALATAGNLLNTYCASCHTGQNAKGSMVIFTSAGVLNPNLDKAAILDAASPGEDGSAAAMPPGRRAKMPKDAIATLRIAFDGESATPTPSQPEKPDSDPGTDSKLKPSSDGKPTQPPNPDAKPSYDGKSKPSYDGKPTQPQSQKQDSKPCCGSKCRPRYDSKPTRSQSQDQDSKSKPG